MNNQETVLSAKHKELHSKNAINQRLSKSTRHSYLKDFVYGSIDGAVTTFAVVTGVAGAGLSSKIVIILGIANLIGDGFSMAVSNFLGTKADLQLRDKARAIEEKHITLYPEGETEEIRQIFARKGFEGEDLERVVNVITSDKDRWVNTMLTEELGFSLNHFSPMRAALATFVAFGLIGFIPLIAFLIEPYIVKPFLISSFLTGIAFFGVGALKSKFVDQNWIISGLETLLLGSTAALLSYLTGYLLKDIFT